MLVGIDAGKAAILLKHTGVTGFILAICWGNLRTRIRIFIEKFMTETKCALMVIKGLSHQIWGGSWVKAGSEICTPS